MPYRAVRYIPAIKEIPSVWSKLKIWWRLTVWDKCSMCGKVSKNIIYVQSFLAVGWGENGGSIPVCSNVNCVP